MITEQQFWDVVEVCKAIKDLSEDERDLFLSLAAPYLSASTRSGSCLVLGDLELWSCNMLSCTDHRDLFEPHECDELLAYMRENGFVSL